MNPLRWLSVSLTLATAEAPTVLSLIGCTRLRAVSGILRTQRGRRGSRGAGLHAGTGSAGPGRRGRPGPISTDLASRPVAQVLRSPLWLKSHARPCGSRPTLAPVAQVSRSPLWLYSGRRRDAGPGSHLHRPRLSPLWLKSHARPCGSSLSLAPVALLWPASGCGPGQPSPPTSPLAPVAQVSRSPLWLNPRPCGSTLAGVGQCPTAIGHGCPAGLRAGVPDRRPVSPLSSSLGAVGRARAGAAVRGSPSAPFSRGPGDGRSRPSHVRG
jgi:hypothetical protein